MITVAVEAAKRGGAVLVENFGRASIRVENKAESDYVTEVDRRSEDAIREFLAAETPEAGFLLEEAGAAPSATGDSDLTWVVDPLDGTTNYIHRLPCFAVSIALRRGAETLVGVVYDPLRGEMFSGELGEPTRLNGVGVEVSRATDPAQAVLATGFPFRHKERLEPYLEVFAHLFRQISGMRRAGAAALDLAYVAAGRLEGFWELGLSPWDTAAGELLVRCAGGRVTDFSGGDDHVAGGDVLAATPALHPLLLEAVAGPFDGVRPVRERLR